MRRSTSCLVEREQKAESHLVTLHKGKARELRTSEGLRSRRSRNQNIRNEQSKLLLDWGRRFKNGGQGRAIEPCSRPDAPMSLPASRRAAR